MIWAESATEQRKEHLTLLGLLAVLLIAFAVAVFWILSSIHARADIRLGSSLQTVLDTTHKALRMWTEQTEADVAVIASDEDLRAQVQQQLQLRRDPAMLRLSPALQKIRHLLMPALELYDLAGFAVVAPDGFQIAADENEAIGTKEITEQNPALISKVMAGNAGVGWPYKPEGGGTLDDRPVLTIAAPIRSTSGEVIAALALNFDARRDFTAVVELARLEATGQTYAFDRRGRLLSESRWTDDGILNTQIRDPGGNTLEGYASKMPRDQQPLTRMAKSAIQGIAGTDLKGYRDYRGVPVIGAWLWDDHLEMGLATEMDRKEAFMGYRRVRNLVVTMLVSLVGVSTLLLLILGQRGRVLVLYERSRLAVHARDDMMAIVAHDLKNPLNSMLLRSYVLLQMTADCGEKTAGIRNNLESLQGTVRHMNRVINDLTDAAKIEAGRLELEPQECPLKEAFQSAVESMRLLFGEKRVDFAAHIPDDGRSINVDLSRLGQALENLLGNALKFTPPGGSVILKVTPLENEVQVSLTDTGPGIPAEAVSRIFEPYWQVDRTRNGMGLGLFISKKIIETHGGKIWVQSAPGRGTTFYFTLPMSIHTPEVRRPA